jgi:hypothetical protein
MRTATSAPVGLLPLSLAARLLRVPTSWLRAEAEAGRLPHLKAGKAILFEFEALERALLARARQAQHGEAAHAP